MYIHARTLQIVDAESCEELQEDAVGEIWIRSESKASLTLLLIQHAHILNECNVVNVVTCFYPHPV